MEHVPESFVDELVQWIAAERDAAWAAKLAILRMRTREDIALFGAHLREHDRHAEELAHLVRIAEPRREIPREPTFVRRDALVIGALDRDQAVIAAMRDIEATRIARYEERARRARSGRSEPARIADALLDRHLADARARLAAVEHRSRASSQTSIRREAAA
jgi:ferritin-like metal-binding protein YciE